jgi:hypothetical protein
MSKGRQDFNLMPFEDCEPGTEPCDNESTDDQSDNAGSCSGDENEICNDQKEDRNEQKIIKTKIDASDKSADHRYRPKDIICLICKEASLVLS